MTEEIIEVTGTEYVLPKGIKKFLKDECKECKRLNECLLFEKTQRLVQCEIWKTEDQNKIQVTQPQSQINDPYRGCEQVGDVDKPLRVIKAGSEEHKKISTALGRGEAL